MHTEHPEVPRRVAVAGLSVAAVAGLAACSRYGGPTAPPPPADEETTTTNAPAGSGSAPAEPPKGLASTKDIPVGGGKVFKDQEVVITQPTAGDFKGFSAICKHQGCIVDNVGGGTINCECHGSKYKLDGSVSAGPAAQPLDAKQVKVDGDQISVS